MRVEKIELLGFKSFCDKTVFNLHPGITCIVGPNGCGKSNIVDAFKWVLGEQSAKSLRGGKMEEVIFTGSASRKPKGMAEVRLSVKGMGGGNGDSTVTIGRRLYRSGDSDYMINRNTCRLRDIRDIFLDTGLEVKSYSILEQDRIAAILSAKPDERRFIIEEVAGVVKYKVRRHEARNKLESSRNNLQRITDITSEIKRQINSLDRQVKRAERFKRLSEGLKEIELRLATNEHRELSEALEAIMAEHGTLKEREASMRAGLSTREGELESRRIALVENEKSLETLQGGHQNVQREIAEFERTIAVLRTERDNLGQNLGRLKAEQGQAEQKLIQTQERTAEIEVRRGTLNAELSALAGRKDDKARLLGQSQATIAELEQRLEAGRRETFGAADALGTSKNEKGRLEEAIEALSRKEESLGREAAELATAATEAQQQQRSINEQVGAKEREAAEHRARRDALRQEESSLKGTLEELRVATSERREELASATSRLESLQEMAAAEGGGEELREELDVVSLISDIIEVPREYELAIESALGEAVSGLVLNSYDEISAAAGAIRQREAGRTAFVPMNPGTHVQPTALPTGALGRASDLVRSKDGFADIVRGLLGGVAVVKDLAEALGMRGAGMTLVTLQGEMLVPTGTVVAGRGKGVFLKKRQVAELRAEQDAIRLAIAEAEEKTAATLSAIAQAEAALGKAEAGAVEAEREVSLLKLGAQRQTEELERIQKKLQVLRMETSETAREQVALGEQIAVKERAIAEAEEEKARVEASIVELQAEIGRMRAEYDQCRTEAEGIGLELNSARERLQAVEAEAASIVALARELEQKGVQVSQEITGTARRIEEREASAGGRETSLRERVIKARELEGRISTERNALSAEWEAVRAIEGGMKSKRTELDEWSGKLSALDVQRTEYRMRAENLVENIRNSYGVELADLKVEPVQEGDEEQRDDLKAKIERLGPVSLGSIEEYEELKERYDFLGSQQEDLQRSIAELEEAIARINATTRKKLREAFDAIAIKFGEVFKTLFGGGKAELVMTDERNILETGIDIVAQPPGKRLQNITLLSGGEKTLTALALLFAGFLIKPTPLCILDEADAALDEANTLKFAKMVKELAQETQFIVVTHNRMTMETADYIYGITMEEPGTSKVISLEMSEA